MKNDLALEYLQKLKEGKTRASTKECYAYDLNIFNRWKKNAGITEVKVKNIHDFFTEQITMKKLSTVNRYRASLIYHYEELSDPDIKKGLDDLFQGFQKATPHITKYSTPLTLALYYQLVEEIVSITHQLIFMLQFKSGARISEILELTVDDIEFKKEGVQLRFVIDKTTNKAQYIGLQHSKLIAHLLNRHIPAHALTGSDPLFTTNRDTLNYHIKKILGEQYSTHSLRSGHIVESLRAGKPAHVVMKTTRHKNTTNFYTHYCQLAGRFDNSTDVITDEPIEENTDE